MIPDEKISFPGKSFIDGLAGECLDIVCAADSAGLLVASGEDVAAYRERLSKLADAYRGIEEGLKNSKEYSIFEEFPVDSDRRISPEIMEEAAEHTRLFYEFTIGWVPGFFLSKSLGWLWGGCAISFPENNLSVFLIRANFAKKKRWLFYRRDELLAHELCHIARMPLKDRVFEEIFAYRLSPSRLRRYMGSCFLDARDAVLFILPVFLLLAVQIARIVFSLEQIPICPFWLFAAAYPAFLFFRNHFNRRRFFRAKGNLEQCGIEKPLAVLFRCTKEEIMNISGFRSPAELKAWLAARADSELRWRVIGKKFLA